MVGDLCQYDMKLQDKLGTIKSVKKPTRWISSNPEMLDWLEKRCDGGHEHANLLSGQAKHAAIWPNE